MRAHAIDTSDNGFPSDTNLLVDACIATVRQAARLDDDAVLPPLPRVAPRRDVVIFTRRETASVIDVSELAILEDDVEGAGEAGHVTAKGPRRARGSRWAVVLCALVAAGFGTAAFVDSPAGQAFARRHQAAATAVETVKDASRSVRAHASAAAQATVALFAR